MLNDCIVNITGICSSALDLRMVAREGLENLYVAVWEYDPEQGEIPDEQSQCYTMHTVSWNITNHFPNDFKCSYLFFCQESQGHLLLITQ